MLESINRAAEEGRFFASSFMKNFWEKLRRECGREKRPIYVLAPMAGFTDSPFRQMCKDFGADVVYSEMISATALAYGSRETLEMLRFEKKERPFVVQLFGSNPDHFAVAAKILYDKKVLAKFKIPNLKIPDGIDINFGCPVKKVAKQGAGATLMKDLKKSKEIIKAVLENTDLPVSVKIRSKAGSVSASRFLKNIQNLDVKAVMIHGRTLAQGFFGDIDLKTIKNARKYFSGVVLANGGINDIDRAREVLEATNADGIGVARGALGKPWVFDELKVYQVIKSIKFPPKTDQPRAEKVYQVIKSVELSARGGSASGGKVRKVESFKVDKKFIFKIALKHAQLTRKLKGGQGIIEMRKHLCWYVDGLPNASELRRKLVAVKSLKEIQKILK